MKKRTVALVFLGLVLALVAATLAVLRTRWAGDRICRLVAARAEAATGLAVAFEACRVDPIRLEVEAEAVRLGAQEAPLLLADSVSARLAPIQALGGAVQLDRLRVARPRLATRVAPGGAPGGVRCPTALLERLEVQQLEVVDGSLELALPDGVRLAAERIDVDTRPAGRLRAIAPHGRRRSRVQLAAARVQLEEPGRETRATALALDAEVALDLSSAVVSRFETEVGGVRVRAQGRVENLCAPRLDLLASAEGSLRSALGLARIASNADADGSVVADAKISGPAQEPQIAGTILIQGGRVAYFTPGDVRADVHLAGGALAVDRLEWTFREGRVIGHGKVGLSLPVALEADVETDGVDLAEVLERLDVGGSWVSVKLDGKGRIGGTLAPPLLAGTVSTEFRELRVLTRSWRAAPATEPGVIEVKQGLIHTGLRVSERGLAFDAARVTAGRGTSEVDAEARFSSEGGFSLRWRGQIDLDAMGRIADIPWAGLAQVDGTISAAPYGNPRVVARGTRVEGFRFLDVDLGSAAADLVYGPDFHLRIQDAQGIRGQTRYRGEGVVDLEPVPAQVLWSRFEAKGRVRDLLDAVRDWVPATRPLRDIVDGDVEVSGTASGKAGFLDGTFEGRLGTGTLFGRPFESGRAEGTFRNGGEARVERAELKRGTGIVRMEGGWGFLPPFPWDIEVSFAGVPLEALELPGGGWGGSASGGASLEGSLEHPRVRFAANGDGVAVHGVPLGTVQMGGTIQERRLILTGTSDVVRFEGEAALEGRLPFRGRAELALIDVARLLPGSPVTQLRARVRGEASAEGELASLEATRARARLDSVEIGHADFRVESVAPVEVTLSRGRVDVNEVVLRGPDTELRLSGSRSPGGELDLSASGTLDLRLLAGVGAELRRPHGRLTLEAHVSGTVPEPVLVGSGRLDDAGFQLKGASVLLSQMRGDLAFSQNRVLFEGLEANVNGGRATLAGEVELASLAPSRVRIEAALDEVPVAVPAWLPATLSGRVEAAGTPQATTVTGRLHVVRARYTADVELEKGLLELRRRPPPPRSYDKAGEWLRFDLQIAADGDCRVENDLVSGDVRGQLTLTGTLASPGLVGTLSMAEGSLARFRGNEFALSHAVLDFTDRNRIEVAMDVHGQSQVRDYQVFMHAFGPLADPQLTLTSSPPLSQPDIITLLSLGFTQRDAGVGTGVSSVAAAAAAQALFSASGLDDQVKRFLPRNGLLRDFSVRITSEWSEASGQVEPRAEFESWLLQDRLRLRYQAPLSGARGQRAQAELRLGKHTAVQYQWDNDNADVVSGDHGVDLKLRWEWTDE